MSISPTPTAPQRSRMRAGRRGKPRCFTSVPSIAPARRAAVTGLAARLALAAGHAPDAARSYEQQAELLRQARLYHDMAIAIGRAGDASRAAGRSEDALTRYFRAGRSLISQGENVE